MAVLSYMVIVLACLLLHRLRNSRGTDRNLDTIAGYMCFICELESMDIGNELGVRGLGITGRREGGPKPNIAGGKFDGKGQQAR